MKIIVRLPYKILFNAEGFTIKLDNYKLGVVEDNFKYTIKTYKTEDQALEALEAVQNKILDALEVGDDYVLISWDDELLEIE